VARFLVFDIGTSGGKAAIIDERGNKLALKKEGWSARETPGLEGYGSEFDAGEIESRLLSCASQVLQESRAEPAGVKGITATSLRFGYVFLDGDDNPVYFGSNMDGRGFFEQDVVEEKLGDAAYGITGLYPPMLFGLSKLLWFKENAPQKFLKISKIMNLNDWWIYRLSGSFCTDHCSASTTGLYDLRRSLWSDEILSAFGLDPKLLPETLNPGSRAGSLKEEFRQKLGLAGADVIVAGPDTQCGLLGAGCISVHELGVVAGATCPCQMISTSPSVNPGRRVLLGAYLVPGKYAVESNSGQGGLSYDWAVKTYVGQGGSAYRVAEEMISGISPDPTGIMSFVGSQIMDLEKLHLMRPSMTVFSSPVVPPFSRVDPSSLLKAVLEEVCFSISCNVDILEESMGESPSSLRVTGGLIRSRSFCRILSNVTAKRVYVSSEPDGTILGAALCTMVGSGEYGDQVQAAKEAVHTSAVIDPDETASKNYAEAKQRWKELYLEITELTEEGKL
jgi:autoinducer 2 (AI-2) kinase